MSVIPNKTSDLITFAEVRAPVWVDKAEEIGLTEAQASLVQTTATAAATAQSGQAAAKAAAVNSTDVLRVKAGELRKATADAVRLIRIYAGTQPNPDEIFAIAMIPPPAIPTPVGPPGVCADFRVGLDQDGAVTLSWKCANPAGAHGTVYMLQRRLNGGTGEFAFLGATGSKKFADYAIPSGTWQIEYRVQGHRSGLVGPAAIWTVRFGMGGGGAFTITEQFAGSEEGTGGGAGGAKLAA